MRTWPGPSCTLYKGKVFSADILEAVIEWIILCMHLSHHMVKLCLTSISLPILEGESAPIHSHHPILLRRLQKLKGVACSRSQSLLWIKTATRTQISPFPGYDPRFFHTTIAIEMLVFGLDRDWHVKDIVMLARYLVVYLNCLNHEERNVPLLLSRRHMGGLFLFVCFLQ